MSKLNLDGEVMDKFTTMIDNMLKEDAERNEEKYKNMSDADLELLNMSEGDHFNIPHVEK